MKTRALLVALLAAAPATASAQPARAAGPPAGARPPVLKDIGFDQRLGEILPLDITLRDESGADVRLGDFFGERPVVLTLVYYECPMLCTVTLNSLSSALATLSFDIGREFEVVTVSFDPREKAPLAAGKKKAYVSRYGRPGAEKGWHFLTGDREQLARLTAAVGFRYQWDETIRQFAHPSGLVVLTPEGRITRYLYGIEYAPKDLRLGLVEAAERRIGTPLDQAMLFCYRYNPATGRYGLLTMRLVRGGAVLTVLALGGFIFTMRRREQAMLRDGVR
jgi:protein SCO1/2